VDVGSELQQYKATTSYQIGYCLFLEEAWEEAAKELRSFLEGVFGFFSLLLPSPLSPLPSPLYPLPSLIYRPRNKNQHAQNPREFYFRTLYVARGSGKRLGDCTKNF
jgi:hypothetical protein